MPFLRMYLSKYSKVSLTSPQDMSARITTSTSNVNLEIESVKMNGEFEKSSCYTNLGSE